MVLDIHEDIRLAGGLGGKKPDWSIRVLVSQKCLREHFIISKLS
jgi:hypothetical protein